jgi:enoyl-CoA hydratase/carnithine racemase
MEYSLQYSDYKCFRFKFDSGVAFVSIDHPPINLLDEVLSQEFDKLGRELETDESVRVVVVQSALPDFFIAHSGLGRVGAASKVVSHTRSFRLTQTIGERFRNMPKATIAKVEGRARGGGSEIALAMDMCFCGRWQSDLRPTRGGDWAGSGWGLDAKIATAHGAGARLGSAPGLQ